MIMITHSVQVPYSIYNNRGMGESSSELVLFSSGERKFIVIAVLVCATFLYSCTSVASGAELGQNCGLTTPCATGLSCDVCIENIFQNIFAQLLSPKCLRVKTADPTSQVKNLPFNRYSGLTTHNSFAMMGTKSLITGSSLLLGTNQMDPIMAQLKNGVRGLMLDMYEFNNLTWLCHTQCGDNTAFQPAINALSEVQTFLKQNPLDIIAIILEDHVETPQTLSKLFDAASLRSFWFPVTEMPKDGKDWPTFMDMFKTNKRLLVFTSKPEKKASEGIAYQWNYMVENQYGDNGMKAGSCVNRGESSLMMDKTKSLVLMNYFSSTPNFIRSCNDTLAPLLDMIKTCQVAAGNRWPNFVAVDFYTADTIFGKCPKPQTTIPAPPALTKAPKPNHPPHA